MLVSLGCGDDSPHGPHVATHPTRGRVVMAGKPVVGAFVVLEPTTETPGVPRPTGRTDGDGKFLLHTYVGEDGAPAGSYRVGVVALRSSGDGGRNLMEKGTALATPATAMDAKYADPARSGLTAQVHEGENLLPEMPVDAPAPPAVVPSNKGSEP